MSTSIRLSAHVRDQLRSYKNEQGMTYDGAILHLLDEGAESDTGKSRNRSVEMQEEDDEHTELPDPDSYYREGATGATDLIMDVLEALVAEPRELNSVAQSVVWDVYNDLGIEPRVSQREASVEIPPRLENLVDALSDRVENPGEHIQPSSERMRDMIAGRAAEILQAVSTYQQVVGNIPLESEKPPELAVPPTRTYEGEKDDGRYVFTIDGEGVDEDVTWGYMGTGPSQLATLILEDAYGSERFAKARSNELYNNCTSSLRESWKLEAKELSDYLDQR